MTIITYSQNKTVNVIVKKYGELKDGDRVVFHGNIGTISCFQSCRKSEYFPEQDIIRFRVTFDEGEYLARYHQYNGNIYGGIERLEMLIITSE